MKAVAPEMSVTFLGPKAASSSSDRLGSGVEVELLDSYHVIYTSVALRPVCLVAILMC